MSQPSSAIIVEGEAPESDEDEQVLESGSNAPTSDLLNKTKTSTDSNVVEDDLASDAASQKQQQQKPQQKQQQQRRYASSALHAKFFQDASRLQSALVARRASTYESASRELRVVASQLAKTHASIQDASHLLRLTTNDLYKLDDRLQALIKTDWLAGL